MNTEEKYQNFDLQVMNWLEGELSEDEKMSLVKIIQTDKDLEQRFLAVTSVDSLLKAEFAPKRKSSELLARLEMSLPSEAQKKQTQKFILDRINKIEERNEKEAQRKRKRKPTSTSTFKNIPVPRRTQTVTKIKKLPQQKKKRTAPPIAFWITLAACVAIGFWGYDFYLHNSKIQLQPKPLLVEFGNLQKISGNVSIIRNQHEIAKTENMTIYVGDTMVTGEKSFGNITIPDGSEINVGLKSKVSFNNDNGSKQIVIINGLVSGKIAKQLPGKPMIFTTPNAQAIVLGTSLEINNNDKSTKLSVTEGKVRLVRLSDGKSIIVTSGYNATVQEGKTLKLEELMAPDDPRRKYRQPGN